VVVPGIAELDGVQTRLAHHLETLAPELLRGKSKVVEGAGADQLTSTVDAEAVAI
jgi:hypothetical protein